MSTTNSSGAHAAAEQPDVAGKFSINEDWLSVIIGLSLLTLALAGLIPAGLIP